MAQSHVTTPATGPGGDTTIKVAAKVLAAGETVQQFEAVTAVDGGAATAIGAGNPLPVTDLAAETALGAPSDAAATTTGSVIAQLRRVANLLAGGIGVTGTFFQATQPVSAASLPLPTGAAQDSTLTANGVLTGAVAETAPGSDTASSGLNGRLQRIAQRLSTIIGVLPTALGAHGGLVIEGVASGVAVPVSGSFSATPPTDITASGTLSGTGSVSITTLNGQGTAIFDITGTFTGVTSAIEGTVDGTNWYVMQYASLSTPTAVSSANIAAPVTATVQASGLSGVRYRVAAISTGSVVVSARASVGNVTVRNVGLAGGVIQIGTVGLVAGSATVGAVNVNSPGSIAAAVQNAITNVASNVISAGSYKTIMFRNLSTSAQSVFIGTSTVTATTGMEIKPGEFLSFGAGECPSNTIGAITSTGTATLISQYVA